MTGPRSWKTLDAATAPPKAKPPRAKPPGAQPPTGTPPKPRPRQHADANETLGDGPVDGWTDTDEFLAVEP